MAESIEFEEDFPTKKTLPYLISEFYIGPLKAQHRVRVFMLPDGIFMSMSEEAKAYLITRHPFELGLADMPSKPGG